MGMGISGGQAELGRMMAFPSATWERVDKLTIYLNKLNTSKKPRVFSTGWKPVPPNPLQPGGLSELVSRPRNSLQKCERRDALRFPALQTNFATPTPTLPHQGGGSKEKSF